MDDRSKVHVCTKRHHMPWIEFLILTIALIFVVLGLVHSGIGLTSVRVILVRNDNGQVWNNKLLGDDQCKILSTDDRYNCHPDPFASQERCEQRGCCWDATIQKKQIGNHINIPQCYYPLNYPKYKSDGLIETNYGYKAIMNKEVKSHWPNDILTLQMDVLYETKTRIHFKIYDPSNERYEVPIRTPIADKKAANPDYTFSLSGSDYFKISIKRKDGNISLFDTSMAGAPIIFTDQFLQISTLVPSGMLYGLGEHRAPLYCNLSQWQQFSFWARDHWPEEGANLYGTHPFFMSFDKNDEAYGVFFLNSNAMDVQLQPSPAATFRTIGGIMDFYVFTGPTPDMVLQQYTDVIGKPQLPAYWVLGFHLCRWGYNSTEGLQKVVQRMRDGQFPYDTQWNDIDYMDGHLDWTYDQSRYKGLPSVIKDLHDHGQHYVIIVDPGISSTQPTGKYPPFDKGRERNIFITNSDGNITIGIEMAGKTAFPDFTHPDALDYWYESINVFHTQLAFDGLWTDMNEPANFLYGSTVGCTNSSLDIPPYVPMIVGMRKLPNKTLCPSAKQYLSSHYNLHSLYGHFEALASHSALEKILGKRSLVISRSTFPGTGQYAGHWSGDNRPTWHDLQQSIPEILSFQMFGIPLVGADVCGFNGDTNEELCTRWMQLGAFYPFMRNHNHRRNKDQDPAAWSTSAQKSMKSALNLRYSLLPYLYTMFYRSHVNGSAVVSPLSFRYFGDKCTHSIDTQFLFGQDLLISPVLQQGILTVNAYFPHDIWYNYHNGSVISHSGDWITLTAPLDTINVHQRAGTIIPTQRPAVTTTAARLLPFSLQVALDANGQASGILYWDDGETINATEKGKYTLLIFTAQIGQVISEVKTLGYTSKTGMFLGAIRLLGLSAQPIMVKFNEHNVQFQYNSKNKELKVNDLSVNMLERIVMKWS